MDMLHLRIYSLQRLSAVKVELELLSMPLKLLVVKLSLCLLFNKRS